MERNWSCGTYAWRIKTRCPMALVKTVKLFTNMALVSSAWLGGTESSKQEQAGSP